MVLNLSAEQRSIYAILEKSGSKGLTASAVAKEMPCSWEVARQILDGLFEMGLLGCYEKKSKATDPEYVYKAYGAFKRYDEA